MSELVVVGVDGSANADAALEWALAYAKDRGARVGVIFAWLYEVIGVPGARFPVETRDKAEARAEQVVDDALARVGSDDVEVESITRLGAPQKVLLEAAADADLLVVGSRGHGGFAGLLLGSVSLQCVTHAPCPTVVVPLQDEG
ncbi:MAG: universal stress protein [Nitriliruptorales bacterium]|nr:universal stress protein [Nitriliruptorales bacterium]